MSREEGVKVMERRNCEWEGGAWSTRRGISNININCNAQTLNVVCYIEIGKADWNILIGQVIPSEPYHWLSSSSQTSRGRGENIVFA